MTDCLNRSSRAYEENTALTNEANAAYNTVANKLKMAMNAVTNAGIEWGNVLLPEVQKGAEWIGKAGEALGNMSDEGKRAYLGIGKTVLVTGALSKGGAAIVKTIGGVAEGIGTLRGLFAGGALTGDAATAAVSIGKVSGAVGGLILACVGAKKASEYVYDLNYNWSKGLEKGDKSIDSSLEKYQKINAAQKEISELKLTIESPESSQEQVETAKQRLEEIKQMLSEEYNLVIKADNSDLDDAVKSAQKISKNELQQSINEQSAELWERRGKFESYVSDYEAEKGRYNNALAKQTKFSDLKRQVSELDSEYRAGNISLAQYNNSIKDLAKNAGLSENAQRNAKAAVNEINTAYDNATYNAEQYSKNMENLTKAYTEVQDKAKNVAKADAEMLNNAAVEGDTAQMEKTLSHMADIVKTYKLNAGEFAQTAALAMNGVDSLNTAWEKGGDTLNGVVNDYIRAMNEFGASAQDTTVGAALIQNGFADIGQAAAKGDEAVKGVLDSIKSIGQQQGLFDGLNTEQITAKINDIAHAIGLLPKNKELTIDGKVVWKSDTSEPDSYEPEDKNPTVVYGKDSTEPDGYQPTDKNATAIFGKDSTEPDGYQPENKCATVYYKVETIGGGILNNRVQGKTWDGKVKENAKGTQNFSGGLAMVNDEEGVSDNRELIIDGGRAFIPHGRNVILPLSRGAKVYTARQTKRIMTAMGIPHYAQGKDNSEAFTTSKDDWTHYTKTHAVTITQELEKWVELSEKFKDNQKDIEDIEEEIYSLTIKQNDERNTASEKWADKRIFNNDWEEYGDDIYSAYDRIKVRNMEMVSSGKMTWDDYAEYMESAGEKMYDSRRDQSEKWLEHEKKYNKLSEEDYGAGLQRMREYTLQMYEQGLIDKEKYRQADRELEEKYLDFVSDKNANEYSAWQNDADMWERMRDTYDDWADYNDSKLDFIKRKIEKVEDFYKDGKISFDEYDIATKNYQMDYYNEQSRIYDEKLQEFSSRISKLREKYSDAEQKLQDSWTVSDRKENIEDLQNQIAMYRNATTHAGQEKLKSLESQLKDAQRQQQLYELQQSNNKVLTQMQSQYDYLEENKAAKLRELMKSTVDIAKLEANMSSQIAAAKNALNSDSLRQYNVLRDIYSAIKGLRMGATYTDSRTINNYKGEYNPKGVWSIVNGIAVGGMGSFVF